MRNGSRLRGGLPCPSGEDHGPLLLMSDGGYHCPHSGHAKGRGSKDCWTDEEVERFLEKLRKAGGMTR